MDILAKLRELAARLCGKTCKCKTCALKKPHAKEFGVVNISRRAAKVVGGWAKRNATNIGLTGAGVGASVAASRYYGPSNKEWKKIDEKKEFAAAEYRGRKVTLNSPRRIEGVTPAKKKRTVFVKNPKTGNVLAVHFGDRSMSDYTKHHNEKRRANFHSRHNCAEKKDKTKAGYWACKNLW